MPYSEYAMPDRKAVAQLKYQVRRFCRQMVESGVDDADITRIKSSLEAAVSEAAGYIDFDDDGQRLDCNNNSRIGHSSIAHNDSGVRPAVSEDGAYRFNPLLGCHE